MISIEIMNHTGHTTIEAQTVEIAQMELTKFLDDCVRKYKSEPPVWVRRVNESDQSPMDQLENPREDNLENIVKLVLQPAPLVGG